MYFSLTFEYYLGHTLGVADLLVPVALMGFALVMVLRLAATGQLRQGLSYVLFLESRRRSLVRYGTIAVACFLLGGVVDGITLLDLVSETVSDILISGTQIAAATSLLLVLRRGLSTHALTAEETAEVQRQPLALAMLGVQVEAREGTRR